jgi:hypothetical protein
MNIGNHNKNSKPFNMKTLVSTAIALFIGGIMMAQTANLKFNLDKNKTYRVKTKTEQTTSYSGGGQQQTINSNTTMFFSLKPISSSADNFQAEVKFDSIKTTMTMPMMNIDINSTKEGNIKSPDISTALGCLFHRLSSNTFNVKMAYTGNVIEISNYQAIADNILQGIDSLQGQAQMMQAQAKGMFTEPSLKGMIESVTAYLPGKEVKEGDKWVSVLNQAGMGASMQTTNNLKLKKINGKQAEITGDATIEPTGGAQTDVRGVSKSTLTIDLNSGWIIKGTSKQHSQGTMGGQATIESDGTTEIADIP